MRRAVGRRALRGARRRPPDLRRGRRPLGGPGQGPAGVGRGQVDPRRACSPPTGRPGSSPGWPPPASARSSRCSTRTARPASSVGLVRHGDVAHLLTVESHLGHDYLARLEAAAPGLADQRHEHLLLESHPYLRSVWAWGRGRHRRPGVVRRGGRSRGPGAAVPDEVLAEVEAEVHPADPMIMVFSSGSTADPKAVVHTHGATVRHAHNLNQLRDLRPDDVIYTPMPLFWVGGLSFSLVAAMHAGASLVFEERFEPGATLALLERERVTQVLGWPHMGKALADHPSWRERDLSSIRSGAATALPAPGDRQPPGPRATSLGMSETLGPHTFEEDVPLPPDKEGSFGRPVPGVEHRVVDPETLDDVPPGRGRRGLGAGLFGDARPAQARAGRHLHRGRLVPHRRRRPLRRRRPPVLRRAAGRRRQDVGHERHPPRGRGGPRGAARGGPGDRHRHRPPRPRPGRGGRRRAEPRRVARRRGGAGSGCAPSSPPTRCPATSPCSPARPTCPSSTRARWTGAAWRRSWASGSAAAPPPSVEPDRHERGP